MLVQANQNFNIIYYSQLPLVTIQPKFHTPMAYCLIFSMCTFFISLVICVQRFDDKRNN